MPPDAAPPGGSSPRPALGNVFPADGSPGVLVRLEPAGDRLVAVEHRPPPETPPRRFGFAARHAGITRAGADDGQLRLEARDPAGANPGALLYAERAALEPWLAGLGIAAVTRALAAEDARAKRGHRRGLAAWTAFLLALLGAMAGTTYAVEVAVAGATGWIPVTWETKLGAGLFEAVTASTPALEDPATTAPVRELFDRLVAARPTGGFRYHLLVADDPTDNAYALPGGGVVLMRGLIEATESPAEIAGVLAHEIEHVRLRHSLRAVLIHLKWRVLFAVMVGDLATLGEVLMARATGLLSLSYSRAHEREADLYAVARLTAAGVDPRGLRDYFARRAETETGAGVAAFASTHPASAERVQYIDALITKTGRGAR